MSVELLPCPFCGSQAYVSEDQSSDYDVHWTWHVDCTGCGATIDFKSTKEQAVNAWNSRVNEPFSCDIKEIQHKVIGTCCACGGSACTQSPLNDSDVMCWGCAYDAAM